MKNILENHIRTMMMMVMIGWSVMEELEINPFPWPSVVCWARSFVGGIVVDAMKPR